MSPFEPAKQQEKVAQRAGVSGIWENPKTYQDHSPPQIGAASRRFLIVAALPPLTNTVEPSRINHASV